jgi:hypothetical protein
MALELKKLTLDGGMLKTEAKTGPKKVFNAFSSDSDDSSDDAAGASEAPLADDASEKEALERAMRHVNDRDWTKFCSGALKYFETKWTKKLEDYDNQVKSESSSSHEPSDDEKDKEQNIFSESKETGKGRSNRYKEESKDEEDENDHE